MTLVLLLNASNSLREKQQNDIDPQMLNWVLGEVIEAAFRASTDISVPNEFIIRFSPWEEQDTELPSLSVIQKILLRLSKLLKCNLEIAEHGLSGSISNGYCFCKIAIQ